MKVLVIGSGGREHALVWKISMSKRVSEIFCAPGNPGTDSDCSKNVPIGITEYNKLVEFAKNKKIDLTVVGPEVPLIEGISDLFKKNNLLIIGPNKKAAQIEGSKVFAKKLMLKYGIPTSQFKVFDDYKLASKYLQTQKYPLVIKADGQCAGKGVGVVKNEKEALKFLKEIMVAKIYGSSGNKIIIEECLFGQEVSFMVATDGENFVSFLPSQDHKPLLDHDKGPNTGGMGAYAPVPFINKKIIKKIEDTIIAPTICAMKKEGCLYRGILYPGLILTKEGPKVLEFNCRLGDPETQPLMMLLNTDIIDIFEAILNNKIKSLAVKWFSGFSVCVGLTSGGYPGKYEKGEEIFGFDKLLNSKNIIVFHAGTKKIDGKIISNGGRVLGITGKDKNLKLAVKNTYKFIAKKRIYFSGMHYRKDIGSKGLDKKLRI